MVKGVFVLSAKLLKSKTGKYFIARLDDGQSMQWKKVSGMTYDESTGIIKE